MDAPDRDEIQREILAHLLAHPEAEETLEGIAEWWLLERAIERRFREVEAALDQLVAEGVLERRGGPGARTRYRLAERARGGRGGGGGEREAP